MEVGDQNRCATTFVISITPFDEEGRLDEEGLRAHLRRLRDAGVGVYLAGSGTSEGNTLSRDETESVLQIGREELKGRVPVRGMGCEPRSAGQMIEFVRMVESVGLDAVQVYSLDVGHGVKPTEAEQEEYFSEVLAATRIPAILSTHDYSGYVVPINLIGRLVSRFDQLTGIVCARQDVAYTVRLLDTVGGRVKVHCGGPYRVLQTLALGGAGFCSGEGNVVPRLCASLVSSHNRGDMDNTERCYARLAHVTATIREAGGVPAIKEALNILGLPGGGPRRPRMPVSDSARQKLADMLDDLDIRGTECVLSGNEQ